MHVFPLDPCQCFGQIASRSVYGEEGIVPLAQIKRENVHVTDRDDIQIKE